MNASAATPEDDWASGPIDEHDLIVLDRLARLYAQTDPVPADLVERLTVAITLDALSDEIASLEWQLVPVGAARGGNVDDQVKTLTFTADRVTTMITITPAGPERVRIDGWLAPAARMAVELRQPSGSVHLETDDDGRFSFDDVASGSTRFVVRPLGSGDGAATITPAVEI